MDTQSLPGLVSDLEKAMMQRIFGMPSGSFISADWLASHFARFPGGIIPEQRLEVRFDNKPFFTVTGKVKKGAVKKVLQGMV